MKKHFILALTLVLAVALSLVFTQSFSVQAQDTGPCAELSGAAYGLCNAYCDAMQCGSSNQHASDTACNKVFDKFLQITGEVPPCLGLYMTICVNPFEDPHDPRFPVWGIIMILPPEEALWYLSNRPSLPCACDEVLGTNSTNHCPY